MHTDGCLQATNFWCSQPRLDPSEKSLPSSRVLAPSNGQESLSCLCVSACIVFSIFVNKLLLRTEKNLAKSKIFGALRSHVLCEPLRMLFSLAEISKASCFCYDDGLSQIREILSIRRILRKAPFLPSTLHQGKRYDEKLMRISMPSTPQSGPLLSLH